jgi:DNA-binding response OmpR family regulator
LNVRLHRLQSRDDSRVEISRGEFSLLCAFLSSPQRVLSRDQLLDLSRLHRAEVYDRTIDVQVMRLRRKMEQDPLRPQFIKTERGAGYFFDKPVTIVRGAIFNTGSSPDCRDACIQPLPKRLAQPAGPGAEI